MNKSYKIPFYGNTADDTHCFQAALKMVLKYFYPAEDYSYEELDVITSKVEGLWTWPMAGLIWLTEKGMEVKNIEEFDYKKFIDKGGSYLIERFGQEVGQSAIDNSDIKQEIEIAKTFIQKVKTEQRLPDINDIKKLMDDGFIVSCNINARAVNEREGYAGHFVIVVGMNDSHIAIHDPGLPSIENRQVPIQLFNASWAYPNDTAKNLMAFKVTEK